MRSRCAQQPQQHASRAATRMIIHSPHDELADRRLARVHIAQHAEKAVSGRCRRRDRLRGPVGVCNTLSAGDHGGRSKTLYASVATSSLAAAQRGNGCREGKPSHWWRSRLVAIAASTLEHVAVESGSFAGLAHCRERHALAGMNEHTVDGELDGLRKVGMAVGGSIQERPALIERASELRGGLYHIKSQGCA